MIYIVGIGPGHKKYIIPKAIDVMEKANIVLGFKRAIESLYFIENKKVVVTTLKEIIEYINNNCDEDIAVAASGDPCYYGITNYIKNNYRGKIEIIPGISSFQYMMSKIAVPWNEAFTGSMHGREEEFVDVVRSHKISIWLTDKTNAPNVLCERLLKARLNLIEESEKASETAGTGIIKYAEASKTAGTGIIKYTEASKTVGTGVMKYTQSGKTAEKGLEIKVYVGENLSYENEKISSGTLSEMARKSYSDLCVVVIEKCIL